MASAESIPEGCAWRPDPLCPEMAAAVASIAWDQVTELPSGWASRERDLVLWDGECGVCARLVSWAFARDRRGALVFVPYQAVPWPPMSASLSADCARAMQVIDRRGRRLRGGRAAILALQRLGMGYLAPLRFPPLVWATELGYRLVARNRRLLSRLFGQS
jgi:predicted DCC family thiol-disulfide oxidoreductase YuxK